MNRIFEHDIPKHPVGLKWGKWVRVWALKATGMRPMIYPETTDLQIVKDARKKGAACLVQICLPHDHSLWIKAHTFSVCTPWGQSSFNALWHLGLMRFSEIEGWSEEIS